MLKLLPRWVLQDTRPNFYDTESVTPIEMAGKLHGAMNELITEYNTFVDQWNEKITAFMTGSKDDLAIFESAMRQEFQDFIDTIDIKIKEIEQVASSAGLDDETKKGLTQMVLTVLDLQNRIDILEQGSGGSGGSGVTFETFEGSVNGRGEGAIILPASFNNAKVIFLEVNYYPSGYDGPYKLSNTTIFPESIGSSAIYFGEVAMYSETTDDGRISVRSYTGGSSSEDDVLYCKFKAMM